MPAANTRERIAAAPTGEQRVAIEGEAGAVEGRPGRIVGADRRLFRRWGLGRADQVIGRRV